MCGARVRGKFNVARYSRLMIASGVTDAGRKEARKVEGNPLYDSRLFELSFPPANLADRQVVSVGNVKTASLSNKSLIKSRMLGLEFDPLASKVDPAPII